MKNLFFILFVASTFAVNASHLLGGYIQTTQRGYSDTIDVIVTLFHSPQGIPGPQTLSLNEYKLLNGSYQSNTTFSLPKQSTSTWQGVNVDVYSGFRVISSGDYRFIYSTCCRGMLSNASSATNSNFTIALDYQKSPSGTQSNSAPIIVNPLPLKWVVGDTATTILFAVDLDGDSVRVVMDDALNQYSNGAFSSLSPFSQLGNYGYYDVQDDGTITWSPSTQGQFGTGYKVEEYRNGILIGVNRIQQAYITTPGSTPNVVNLTPSIVVDLVNGDSLYFSTIISNSTSTSLTIPGINITQITNSTWALDSLQVGTHKGVLRASNSSSNMDYYITLVVTSTIGIREEELTNIYTLYDWGGNVIYKGEYIPWSSLNGLYIIKHNEEYEKVYINGQQ
jgi:hypothetical protein